MRWLVIAALVLTFCLAPISVDAQAPYYLFTFDDPIVTPPGGAAAYSITQGYIGGFGVDGSSAVLNTSNSPNVLIMTITLYQSVYISTVELYYIAPQGGNACFQFHWDNQIQGHDCRHGTGWGGFPLNKTVPPVFEVRHVMIGYGNTRTIGFDNLKLNVGN